MGTSSIELPEMSMDVSQNELGNSSVNRSRAETPGSEKIQLLRQQMELNRRKMAERESSKRDIEVMVSQLKAKFDDTQQSLHRSTELGRSMGDLSSIGGHSVDRNQVRQLEAKVRLLETELSTAGESKRIQILEAKVLDLEETIREKDLVIGARTQAVTLVTENMSLKRKDTVDLLEDTKQEMLRMQENFLQQEITFKSEVSALNKRLGEREDKIANLEEVVDLLESTRYELTVKNAELLNQINDVKEYSSKIEELNLLNHQLQLKIAALETESKHLVDGQNTTGNSELDKEIENSVGDFNLQQQLTDLKKTYQEQCDRYVELDEKLTEKTVELCVLQANYNVLDERLQTSGPRSLFSSMANADDASNAVGSEEDVAVQSEVVKLKAQLDEANKVHIKTKLKMKQMQKQMDSLKRASDQNKLIITLQEENQQLMQRLTDLEQQEVTSEAGIVADDSDLGKKVVALETTCHDQTAAINLLEEQKVDLVDDLAETRAALEKLRAQMDARESNTVTSALSSIELEEQMELHMQDKATLTLQVEDLNEVVSGLKEQVRKLKEEKMNLDSENQKLTEKLDKVSEKVSSAESIEILENLTHQEKMEMEDQQHKEARPVAEESAELALKIEMFTAERKEVLEKMDRVMADNAELIVRNEEMIVKEKQLLQERDELQSSCSALEERVANLQSESKLLDVKVPLLDLHYSTDPGTLPKTATADKSILMDSVQSLETEVDNYMKCKDKNGKLATSKKLAKQAKSCVAHFRATIVEGDGTHSDSAEELDHLRAMLAESQSKGQATKEQLSEELRSVQTALMEANNAQEEMRGQISVLLDKLSHKDELLQEHETDTSKLLADIKLLQETVQDNSVVDDIHSLRGEVEKRDEELIRTRASLEEVHLQLSRLTHEISEQERREAMLSVEKDTTKKLIDEQKRQIIEQLIDHEAELTEKERQIASLEQNLNRVTSDLDDLRNRQEEKETVAVVRFREEIQFKQDTIDTLNGQIMELYKSMDGNANLLLEKEDEIADLNQVIEDNNEKLKTLTMMCATFESTIQEMETKLRDVEEKHSKAANATDDVKIGLEQRIRELEVIVHDLDEKNKEQLEKLKKFAANLKKKVAQCNDLEKQLKRHAEEAVSQMAAQSAETNNQLLEMRGQQVEDSQRMIQSLEASIQCLTDKLRHSENELVQADISSKELMRKYQDMERGMFVEQERHQQSAAEKKSDQSDLQEKIVQLEQALAETNELFMLKDLNIKELATAKGELESKIDTLAESLEVKAKEVEKCKILIKKRMKENKELNTQISLNPVDSLAKDETIQLLRSQLQDAEPLRNQVQMYETKIQENGFYIDSLEGEKQLLQMKIQKLEEGIGAIEERRNSMEQKVNLLGATLQDNSLEFQEQEDLLVQRLSSLSAHDELIMGQLAATKQENEGLLVSLEEHVKNQQSLQQKISCLEAELQHTKENVIANLEQEVQQLSYQLTSDSQETRNNVKELERQVREKEMEMEGLENEMSAQFVNLEKERKIVQEQHEKLVEKCAAQSEELVQLRQLVADMEATQKSLNEEADKLRMQCDSLNQDDEEAKDLRMQVLYGHTEIEHLRAQNLELSQSHEQELDRLRIEIIKLQENSQMDQLRCGLEEVNRELAEKERLIVDLQQKNKEAWSALDAKNELIDRLGTKVHDINEKQLSDFNEFSASMNAVKGELLEKDHLIATLHGEISRNAQIITELQGPPIQPRESDVPDVNALMALLNEKEVEVAYYQQKLLQLEMSTGGETHPVAPPSMPAAQMSLDTDTREAEEKLLAVTKQLESSLQRSVIVESDLASLSDKYMQTQQHLLERDADLQRLSMQFDETQSLYLKQSDQVEGLMSELEHLQHERSKYAVNEIIYSAEQNILSAVPVQGDAPMSQESASNESVQETDVQLLEELDRFRTLLTEKNIELDIALARIRELEGERWTKKGANVAEKQVAQVSPQQVPEDTPNIPAFSTAQYFDTLPAGSVTNFFDQTATTLANAPIVADPHTQQQLVAPYSADGTDYDSRVPVEEEIIVPKKAYVCFPDAPEDIVQPDSSSMTPNVDDNWGWNAEEAILEEQHQRMTYQECVRPSEKINELESKVQELQLERDRQRNEIHESQLKSAKMLKKLKEYKAANENLVRQKSKLDANDMDQFIQQELRDQVLVLEARLLEGGEKQERDSAEREAISSRVSQLTASNAKLEEIRRLQELEVERHLTEIRHLRSALQKVSDWQQPEEGSKEQPKQEQSEDSSALISELERKISNLTADNDELQALLEDEKETNQQLERRLMRFSDSQNEESGRADQRIKELEGQLKDSIEQIDLLTRESIDIKVHLERLAGEHSEILHRNQGIDGLEQRVQYLLAELEYKTSENEQMKQKIVSQMDALVVAENNLREMEQTIEKFQNKLTGLEEPVIKPRGLEEPVEDFRNLYEELKVEKTAMEHELQVLNDQVLASLQMEDKMKAIVLEFDLKQIEINELKSTIEQLRRTTSIQSGEDRASPSAGVDHSAEVVQLRAEIEQVTHECSRAVEKRGCEVAEIWKAHLEAVQKEYEAQITLLKHEVEPKTACIEVTNQVPQEKTDSVAATAQAHNSDAMDQSALGNVIELRSALESQELEIVTLKEQLAIRSAEFAALSARLDPYGHKATSNMVAVQPNLGRTVTDAAMPPVGMIKKRDQSELDLALYMLHQRDMRCEELTHELLILLEERDTLQLKWSDCMRQLEGIRIDEGSTATTSGEITRAYPSETLLGVGEMVDQKGGLTDRLDAK